MGFNPNFINFQVLLNILSLGIVLKLSLWTVMVLVISLIKSLVFFLLIIPRWFLYMSLCFCIKSIFAFYGTYFVHHIVVILCINSFMASLFISLSTYHIIDGGWGELYLGTLEWFGIWVWVWCWPLILDVMLYLDVMDTCMFETLKMF